METKQKNTLLYIVMYLYIQTTFAIQGFYFFINILIYMFYQVRRYYLKIRGLVQSCDTVTSCWIVDFWRYRGNFLKFHYTGKIWKNKIIPFQRTTVWRTPVYQTAVLF